MFLAVTSRNGLLRGTNQPLAPNPHEGQCCAETAAAATTQNGKQHLGAGRRQGRAGRRLLGLRDCS